ncbi:MAG TPA: vWA domain-containing protein [Polyangiaceae bacterium]|nr:vWA domain-containing protein [Polyangiaceae bacterium]
MSKLAVFASTLLASAFLYNCSSKSDDDDAGSGGGINVGSSTGSGIGVGSNGGGTGTYDGGEIPITPTQVTSIKNQACAGESVATEALPSVLDLVIDTSSSMNQAAPGGGGSKWEVTRAALLEAVVGVNGPGLPAGTGVGLIFYPNKTVNPIPTTAQPVTSCVNTSAMVAPALLGAANAPHRTLIRNAIQQVQLASSTPTHDAYKYAFENGISKTNIPGRRFMLLITDGTPTLSLGCMNRDGSLTDQDPSPIVDQIRTVAAAGIKTFLIGSPGSEANRNWMSQAAVIGGTSTAGCNVNGPNYCHMDMTTAPNFSNALRDGLAAVVGAITSCTYEFATPPAGQTISANNITVTMTSGNSSTLIVRDDIGECTKGWQLTPDNHIQLCPDTCATVQADPLVSVDVMFGCESPTKPPA